MSFSAVDHGMMARALQLAELGLWTTSPNPRVGCVLVQAGEIVGEGWHEKAGEPHAEVHALRAAGAQSAWRNRLRDAGTLQPYGPNASVCRGIDRCRRIAGGCGND
jgi:pyrimidine deaminase RibD-like protein